MEIRALGVQAPHETDTLYLQSKNLSTTLHVYIHSSNLPPLPPFLKGGMDFLKIDQKGRGIQFFFLIRGGVEERGGIV